MPQGQTNAPEKANASVTMKCVAQSTQDQPIQQDHAAAYEKTKCDEDEGQKA